MYTLGVFMTNTCILTDAPALQIPIYYQEVITYSSTIRLTFAKHHIYIYIYVCLERSHVVISVDSSHQVQGFICEKS